MRFTKMQGCGNDFLIFDPGEVEGMDLHDLATKACDRHFGVGADGILIPASSGTADLEMVYLNSDGSYSEMCGNGLRSGLISAHQAFGDSAEFRLDALRSERPGDASRNLLGAARFPIEANPARQ